LSSCRAPISRVSHGRQTRLNVSHGGRWSSHVWRVRLTKNEPTTSSGGCARSDHASDRDRRPRSQSCKPRRTHGSVGLVVVSSRWYQTDEDQTRRNSSGEVVAPLQR
jgi:hypothetical protein